MFIAASVKPASASRTAPARLTDPMPWKSRGQRPLSCSFLCVTFTGPLFERRLPLLRRLRVARRVQNTRTNPRTTATAGPAGRIPRAALPKQVLCGMVHESTMGELTRRPELHEQNSRPVDHVAPSLSLVPFSCRATRRRQKLAATQCLSL